MHKVKSKNLLTHSCFLLFFFVFNSQMFDMWLRRDSKYEGNGIVPLCGTLDIDDERDPDYHFKIQGDNGIVSIRTGKKFEWKLVVIPSQDPKKPEGSFVGFVHDNDLEKIRMNPNKKKYIEEFVLECETGEGTFHLVVELEGQRRHLKLNDKDERYPVTVNAKEYNPMCRAGLVDGQNYFIFEIGQKW